MYVFCMSMSRPAGMTFPFGTDNASYVRWSHARRAVALAAFKGGELALRFHELRLVKGWQHFAGRRDEFWDFAR